MAKQMELELSEDPDQGKIDTIVTKVNELAIVLKSKTKVNISLEQSFRTTAFTTAPLGVK